jgi:hypothetical protein
LSDNQRSKQMLLCSSSMRRNLRGGGEGRGKGRRRREREKERKVEEAGSNQSNPITPAKFCLLFFFFFFTLHSLTLSLSLSLSFFQPLFLSLSLSLSLSHSLSPVSRIRNKHQGGDSPLSKWRVHLLKVLVRTAGSVHLQRFGE